MKTKILVSVLLFLIVVNLATLGTYLYWRYSDHPMREESFPPLEGQEGMPMGGAGSPMLHLAPEQREQMMELMHGFREETRDIHQAIIVLEDQTFDLLQQDIVPIEKVDANLKELSALRFEMSRKATERLIKAKAFLSPQQQRMFYGGLTHARPRFGPMMGQPGFGARRGMGPRGQDSIR